MTNEELTGHLRNSIRELHEAITRDSGENMFDGDSSIEERVYVLELAVSELTREFSKSMQLIAELTLKMSENMGIVP